ncbi:MAG: hypothetical protein ABW128_16085 [Rhizorhabdus sp.]
MPILRFVAITATLLLAACGHSGPPPGHAARGPSTTSSEMTAALDCRIRAYASPDGSVARAALDKGLKAEFATADANGDGGLQKAEIAALNAARGQRCDSEPVIDWEGAGRMTYAAYAARIFTLFDRTDADADGVLSADEIAATGRPRRGIPPPKSSSQGPT